MIPPFIVKRISCPHCNGVGYSEVKMTWLIIVTVLLGMFAIGSTVLLYERSRPRVRFGRDPDVCSQCGDRLTWAALYSLRDFQIALCSCSMWARHFDRRKNEWRYLR